MGIVRRVSRATGAANRHEKGKVELLATGARHRGDSSRNRSPLISQQMIRHTHAGFPVDEARLPPSADNPGRAYAEPPQSFEFGNPHFELLQPVGLGLAFRLLPPVSPTPRDLTLLL